MNLWKLGCARIAHFLGVNSEHAILLIYRKIPIISPTVYISPGAFRDQLLKRKTPSMYKPPPECKPPLKKNLAKRPFDQK